MKRPSSDKGGDSVAIVSSVSVGREARVQLGAQFSATLSYTELLRPDRLQMANTFCLVGTPQNADLICRLYEAHGETSFPTTIKLASPAAADEPDDGTVPPSLGGWHTMTDADYATYRLIEAQLHEEPEYHHSYWLKLHPAYAALSFLPSLRPEAAIDLLGKIVDPRFHVDPAQPDRLARLRAFLGLNGQPALRGAAAYDAGCASDQRYSLLDASVVFATWSDGYADAIAKPALAPREFLFRVMKSVKADTRAEALLKASHVFVRFLRDVWLDQLTPPRKYHSDGVHPPRLTADPAAGYCPQLFVPRLFFGQRDEAEAWEEHVRSLRNQTTR